ncbi:MAG: 4Fe-4S binding protein [Gammaproteobacteria bacterium]|nr:4Fe-4S binding protein [Gammaproteobacteria bacterium]
MRIANAMPSFTETAIKLYRQLFGTPAMAGQLADGIETVLDGNTAVAIAEACIADTAALGNNSAGIAWQSEQQRNGSNMFGALLHSHDAESPRGALAAATGLAMAGRRATLFLDGQELATAQDLLVSAAGRHLPLVLHLSNRALAAHGGAIGSGHETVHLSADSGCFTLFAGNVQQAVDFTLIARRVAELSLTPCVVAMDGEQTAGAGQEVKLPSPALVREFIGAGDAMITAPNEAQKLLFGEQRRRVPRWHDLDNPALHGALQDSTSYALGGAARNPWFDHELPSLLEQAFTEFARLTGRHYGAVSSHNVEKAKLLLVAQGSAVESAVAVARYLGKKERLKIGVIGLHTLRPLPGAELAKLLAGKKAVAVLERCDTPLAEEPPLLRELRSAVERALENGRYGSETHPGYPMLQESERPRLLSVIYGLGGLPLQAADLIALCKSLDKQSPARRYLGIDFQQRQSRHPKRQVLLDTLRRHYPEVEKLGLRSHDPAPDLRPAGTLSLAIHRLSGEHGENLALEAGSFLHQLLGGQVRSHPAQSWERWGAPLIDRIHQAPGKLLDSGEDTPIDCALVATDAAHPHLRPLQGLVDNGLLLMDGSSVFASLPSPLQQAIRAKQLQLFQAPAADGETAAERKERLLGALFGALLACEKVDLKPRRIRSAREEALSHLGETERLARLNAFDHGLESVERLDPRDGDEQTAATPWRDETTPMAVRHLRANTSRYDSLPRFHDQVGVLYHNGETDQLTADPYLATGTIPPLSATFRDHTPSRRQLPQFDAAHCTACGNCWSACPDSAIGATAIKPRALVETGIALARAGELRAIAGKLASGITTLARKGETEAVSAKQLLADGWAWLEQKAPVAEERREGLEAALERVRHALAGLPLSITEPLFYQAEKAQKESGELLSLSINPDSCKGCGLCAEVCTDEALTMQPAAVEATATARQQWQLWQQTPDTPSATIERLSRDQIMDPIAALMLSRHCAFALSGGDGAEAGSGEKIAVRHVLAATEYQQQPLLHRFIQELGSAQGALGEKLRDTLAEALPTEDLDQLSARLQQIHTREATLSAFIQGGDELIEGSGVDAVKMRKLITLTQRIGDLHWRISRGEHDLGRARYGLAFAPGSAAAWAGAFPHNPFHAPVTIDMTGSAPQLAAGLLHGQLNEALEAIGLLRQARAELDPKAAAINDEISWQSLSEEERGLVPPLLLIGNDQSLGGEGFSQVVWLLNSQLPVKILVLADLDFGLGSHGIQDAPLNAQKDPRGDLALVALAQRNAYVAQSSFATPQHLRESVRGMLRYGGPALLRIHAPSPERHGFAVTETLSQARLAVESRTLPLFRYDPRGEGVFGSRLTLEGNSAAKQEWLQDENGKPITPVHWARNEQRFAPRTEPLHRDAPAPTELLAWLALEQEKRTGKTPFIAITDHLGNEQRLAVDIALANLVERQHHTWRTLQELAGLVTPFTARVEAEAKQNLAATHQAELDALRGEYEEKLRTLEEQMHGQMHEQITQRLMELAGY